MEFPPTCEVRVNGEQLQANLKGLKKKPGTTPPPNLGRLVGLSTGAVNQLNMIYDNDLRPVLGKVSLSPLQEVKVVLIKQLSPEILYRCRAG